MAAQRRVVGKLHRGLALRDRLVSLDLQLAERRRLGEGRGDGEAQEDRSNGDRAHRYSPELLVTRASAIRAHPGPADVSEIRNAGRPADYRLPSAPRPAARSIRRSHGAADLSASPAPAPWRRAPD